MGRSDLEDEVQCVSQDIADRVEDAEDYRTPSDPGDSAEECSVQSSQSSSGSASKCWWVTNLLEHVSEYGVTKESIKSTSVHLVSGCSGLLAEGFALKDCVPAV